MLPFHQQLLELLSKTETAVSIQSLSAEDEVRLDRFARLSPLYRQFLLNHPEDLSWLLEPPFPDKKSSTQEIYLEWNRFRKEIDYESAEFLPTLRRFRRRMSMRMAWRDIFDFQNCRETMQDLSALAELSVRETYAAAFSHWEKRVGEPWNDSLDQPARFCVLALGKLGGSELNFSSDIDLIYLYEGDGFCRKEGETGKTSTQRFFTKVAEMFTHSLQEQTEHGFLFRVDLRLRPEGQQGPLVRSFAAMENHYAENGQTWERLALIKARPIAGDPSLGGELLENLHSFRYPRHPPASLLSEIASMKTRTEKEVVGAENLSLDLKSGYGGIREIEFIVQTLQLLHAGRFPFLQTASTVEGLEQLARYELMARSEVEFLKEAYFLLRSLEHRLQIREEQQTHSLPNDPEQLALLAESFQFSSVEVMENRLDEIRSGVRSRYDDLLRASPADEELSDWWAFFSEERMRPDIEVALERWFGSTEESHRLIREFVRGNRKTVLTREQISRFIGLTKCFDRLMPRLAFPMQAIRRISTFADAYGTRRQFLSTCSLDPSFFEVLALLFDRSSFIFEVLSVHPEILEEVLRPEILRRRKTVEETVEEMAPGLPAAEGEDWLWLYVKAEQIRIAIGDLLGYLEQEETEQSLTVLADAVLVFLMKRFDPGQRLLLIALGKYGGSEMTFGSDLDLLFLGEPDEGEEGARVIRSAVRSLSRSRGPGGIYEVDLRLRPHGTAGPLAPTLAGLIRYYQREAQPWEKQMLGRARVVTGNEELKKSFDSFLEKLLYAGPAGEEELRQLWQMRLRIERERDRAHPPQRAFKTGPGGIVDVEFFGQFLQLRFGSRFPELRQSNTRKLLRAAGKFDLMEREENERLLENFGFLKRVEVLLRRDRNAAVSVIGDSPEELFKLARWSGFETADAFWDRLTRVMESNREMISRYLQEKFQIELETVAPFSGPKERG